MVVINRSLYRKGDKLKLRIEILLILIFFAWGFTSCAKGSMTPSLQDSARNIDLPLIFTKTPFNTPSAKPLVKTATIAPTLPHTQVTTPTDVKVGVDLNGLEIIDARNVNGLVQLWKLKLEQEVKDYSFLPYSSEIAIGTSGETLNGQDSMARIHIWDLLSGTRRTFFDLDTSSLDALSVNPDGKTAAIVAGSMKFIDLKSGEIKNTQLSSDLAADPIQINYSPSGDTVAMGFALIGTVVTVNSYTGEQIYSAGGWFEPSSNAGSVWVNSDIRCLEFRPDGKQLAVCDAPGGIAVLDSATGATVVKIPLSDKNGTLSPFSLEYTSNGKILVIGDTGGKITFWDVAENKIRMTLINPDTDLNYPYNPYTVSTGEGDIIFSYTSNSNNVFVWEIQSEQMLYKFSVGEDVIKMFELSPDGKVLAVLGKDALYFYGVPIP